MPQEEEEGKTRNTKWRDYVAMSVTEWVLAGYLEKEKEEEREVEEGKEDVGWRVNDRWTGRRRKKGRRGRYSHA